jgi:hypothetical protein
LGTVGKIVALSAFLAAGPVSAQRVDTHDPDLPRNFTFALADVCLPMVHGRVSLGAPSEATRALHIAPVQAPAYLGQHYDHTPMWFSPESSRSIFVGQRDDRPVCRLVLGDSSQTLEIQAFLTATLPTLGFVPVAHPPGEADRGYNEELWARREDNGYVVLMMQGPRAPVADGAGDQLMVGMSLRSVAEFESMTRGH